MSLLAAEADAHPAARQLRIRPWEDPVLEQHGHDPRGEYAELFWLPLLGPSATFLARHLAAGLDRSPAGFSLPADDAARALGLGPPDGRRSPFNRTLARLAQFRIVHLDADDEVLARRRLPGLTRTQVAKLPPPLRLQHDEHRKAEFAAPATPVLRERARLMALTLLQLDESPPEILAHLHRLRFDPPMCRQALAWALARHHPPPP